MIEVINQGSVPATDIQISDYIPAGLTLNDAAWTENAGIATLNTPIASLAKGASMMVDIDFTIDADFMGTTIRNWAEISDAENPLGLNDEDSTPDDINFNQDEETDDLSDDNEVNDPDDEDDHDPAEITVNNSFDLALRKTVSSVGPFVPGGSVTFSIEVFNQGTLDAQNIQISDYIPTGLTLNDANWQESNGEAFLITPIPSLSANASTSVNISFTIDPAYQGASIRNWAEISSAENQFNLPDEDSSPDAINFSQNGETNDLSDDDTIDENGLNGGDEDDHDPAEIDLDQTFDLALSKVLNTTETPGPFQPGSTVSYIITVFNQGTVDASNIQISDYIPNGLTLIDGNWTESGGTATLVAPIASLAAGASTQVTIDFTIDTDYTGTSLRNWAEISEAENTLSLPMSILIQMV